MGYRRLGEDHTFKVGDLVWILAELPHRYHAEAWKGEVVAVHDDPTAENGYKSLRVKLTDGRLQEIDNGYYFDREPTVVNSYDVYPRGGTHVDDLIARLEAVRDVLERERRERLIRERTFKEMFVALYDGRAKKAAEEAFERGMEEGEAKAVKGDSR